MEEKGMNLSRNYRCSRREKMVIIMRNEKGFSRKARHKKPDIKRVFLKINTLVLEKKLQEDMGCGTLILMNLKSCNF